MTMFRARGLHLVLAVEATFSQSSGRVYALPAILVAWLIVHLQLTTVELNAIWTVVVMAMSIKNHLRVATNVARIPVPPRRLARKTAQTVM